jgi:hypothetical protein
MNAKRKRTVRTAVAALGFFLAAWGANGFALGRLTLGIKGGINSANLRIVSENTVSSYQTVTRLTWGGFLGFRITDSFSIQVEVLNSPKGSRFRGSSDGIPVETTLKYDYTEVPVLIRYSQRGGGRLTPTLFAGPYVAFRRSAEATYTSGGRAVTETLQDQRDSDYGITFGASLAYKLGAIALVADLRYDLGLTDVDKAPGSTFNHRALAIMIGVGI